ncbi:MAG: gfo/Idh/MocA family oxidoreductase, partial [Nitrospirota bacterium]|nr:gfo/Idh/MocA family oxidoreductase [Nitrospirota bacterium]
AWEYSIPLDATPETCDWERFQGNAPKRPWDAKRFFRWRNYRDYGTGVAGDLFVHLLTGLHTVTNSFGPTRVYATGGIRFWTDREVPDVMLATLDYPATNVHPAFNVILHVNFKSSLSEESFGVKFTGSDGVMTADSFNKLTLDRTPRIEELDWGMKSLPDKMQKELTSEWKERHPQPTTQTIKPGSTEVFDMSGSDAHVEHHKNFYHSIRESKPSIEDSTFGLRAAGPALLTNDSYFDKRIVGWNPEMMTETQA